MPETNGTDVLLKLEVSPGVFQILGSQRGVTFGETTAPIDMSSKNSRNYKGKPGRYSSTASLQHLYVPNASGYDALKAAMRDGTLIRVERTEFGTDLEEADAIVTNLSGDFPDQEAAVISVDLQITGAWDPA